MEHLTIQQLLTHARRGETPAHTAACAFCREQLALAQEYLAIATVDEITSVRGGDDFQQDAGYRLAAQTLDFGPVMFRLRRTWYIDNNSVILRVIEDMQRKVLTGFFISENLRAVQTRIRFDGIDREFMPDLNGVFEIGSANIDIEPMNVTVTSR